MKPTVSIPTDFLDALMSKKLNGTEIQAALALAKLTWGEGLDEVQVTLTKLADMLSTGRPTVAHALARLAEYKLLVVRRCIGDHRGNVYRLVPQVPRWNAPLKTPELRVRVFRRDDYTCQYCGTRDPDRMTLDHLVPQIAGGPADLGNLVASCVGCNLEKSSVGLGEFFRRHPVAHARLGPLLDCARVFRPPPRPAWAVAADRRPGAVAVPEMEARDLPSAAQARMAFPAFVCPIFERRCPLTEGERWRVPIPKHRED